MADGASTALNGYVERSRFRQDFKTSAYERRKVSSPKSRIIQDIAPHQNEVRHREPPTNLNSPTHPSNVEALRKIDDEVYQQADSRAISNRVQAQHTIKDSVYTEKHSKLSRSLINLISLTRQKSKPQLALLSLAIVVVVAGGYISFSAWHTNQTAQVAVAKLTSAANQVATHGNGSSTNKNQALSTVKPSPVAVAAYAVAPSLPKYLKIPAIGVNARVLQVGVLASGALGTPDNVFDTAWYSGSSEPGQPGATLIDGHVSSWTSHGVFYNLHNLKAGDSIQIVKGDNTVVNYRVVKIQVYGANNVNMQAAITPITPSVSGLNLITCTGQVIKGTSLFNQRVIVFAQEVS